MRIKINHGRNGSALLIALLTAFIVGLALTSYLTMVSNQNRSTMRSLAWNSAIPVVEAGLEEALTQLFHTSGITNLSINNWTLTNDATGVWYFKQHWLDSGSYYEVYIKQQEPPIIVSTAFVPAPMTYSMPFNEFMDKRLAAGPSVGMILGGAITPSPTTGQYVKRRVRLTTVKNALYRGALVTVTSVSLNGNGITTDSYDSTQPNVYSGPSGEWSSIIEGRAHGNVGCNGTSINIGNAKIKGYVATGPGGAVQWGSQGVIGSVGWVDTGHTGPEDYVTWLRDDFHADAFPVPEPYLPSDSVSITSPPTTNINGIAYTYLSQSGPTKYSLTSFPAANVYVTGNVTVRLSGVSGSVILGDIVLAPGASLNLYVAAASTTVSGNINSKGKPENFQYYGLPSNTAYKASGNAEFVGCIYAPNAAFTLGGGGNSDLDFVGSCVVNTASMGGHYKFHFDESLQRSIFLGYVVTSWNEVDPNAALY
jgi:hypothetical protein